MILQLLVKDTAEVQKNDNIISVKVYHLLNPYCSGRKEEHRIATDYLEHLHLSGIQSNR